MVQAGGAQRRGLTDPPRPPPSLAPGPRPPGAPPYPIPRSRLAGWALTPGPEAITSSTSAPALAVPTGTAAGILLLGAAGAGFQDLAALRPAHPRRPAPREGPMIMSQGDSPT